MNYAEDWITVLDCICDNPQSYDVKYLVKTYTLVNHLLVYTVVVLGPSHYLSFYISLIQFLIDDNSYLFYELYPLLISFCNPIHNLFIFIRIEIFEGRVF